MRFFALISLSLLLNGALAQSDPNCFTYTTVPIPLDGSKFKSEPAGTYYQMPNRLSYGERDRNTFWYRLRALESTEVVFSIFSLNYKDIYDPLVFDSNHKDVCSAIVSGDIEPMRIHGEVAFSYGNEENRQDVREYTFMAEGGVDYFIGVIEIFGDGCGHKLFLTTEQQSSLFRAAKNDCPLVESLIGHEDRGDLSRLDDTSLIGGPIETAQEPTGLQRMPTESPQDLENLDAPMTMLRLKSVPLPDSLTQETLAQGPPVRREHFPRMESYDEQDIQKLETDERELVFLAQEEAEEIDVIEPEKIVFRDWKTGDPISHESIEVGQQIVLNKIYFHNNTYAFKFPAQFELEKLAQFLIDHPSVELEVQGHSAGNTKKIVPEPRYQGRTDGWGFKGSSFELSEARANAVKNFLIAQGVEEHRLRTVGFGDKFKLIKKPRNFEDAKKNMRVEIMFTAR